MCWKTAYPQGVAGLPLCLHQGSALEQGPQRKSGESQFPALQGPSFPGSVCSQEHCQCEQMEKNREPQASWLSWSLVETR
jgi:hypothetical protein